MLSVILPTYERPGQLAEALEGLSGQDLSAVDEILVGDNSRDELAAANQEVVAAAGCAALIDYRRNDPAQGQFGNVKELSDRAASPYLMLVHDDDRLLPGAIETLVERVVADQGDENVRVWFGRNLNMTADGVIDPELSRTETAGYDKAGPEEVRPLWRWCLTMSMPPNSFIMRTTDFRRFLPGERNGNIGEWRMWVRMANAGGDAHFVPHDVFAYRSQPGSVSNSGRQIDVHLMYEGAHELAVPDDYRKAKLSLERRFSEVALRRYLRDGDVRRARQLFVSASSPVRRPHDPRVLVSVLGVVSPRAYQALYRLGARSSM